MNKHHGPARRIVAVIKDPNREFCGEGPERAEKQMISRWSEKDYPLGRTGTDGHPWTSKAGHVRVYSQGFRDAAENFSGQIEDFLKGDPKRI
jgi:hypothetical protein